MPKMADKNSLNKILNMKLGQISQLHNKLKEVVDSYVSKITGSAQMWINRSEDCNQHSFIEVTIQLDQAMFILMEKASEIESNLASQSLNADTIETASRSATHSSCQIQVPSQSIDLRKASDKTTNETAWNCLDKASNETPFTVLGKRFNETPWNAIDRDSNETPLSDSDSNETPLSDSDSNEIAWNVIDKASNEMPLNVFGNTSNETPCNVSDPDSNETPWNIIDRNTNITPWNIIDRDTNKTPWNVSDTDCNKTPSKVTVRVMQDLSFWQ